MAEALMPLPLLCMRPILALVVWLSDSWESGLWRCGALTCNSNSLVEVELKFGCRSFGGVLAPPTLADGMSFKNKYAVSSTCLCSSIQYTLRILANTASSDAWCLCLYDETKVSSNGHNGRHEMSLIGMYLTYTPPETTTHEFYDDTHHYYYFSGTSYVSDACIAMI